MCNLAAMPENMLNYNSYVKHTKTLPSHSERATKYVTGLLEVNHANMQIETSA